MSGPVRAGLFLYALNREAIAVFYAAMDPEGNVFQLREPAA